MPHFKSISGHEHDDYWKFEGNFHMTKDKMRSLLGTNGYKTNISTSLGELERVLSRMYRGLPSLHDKSNKQLRQIVNARGTSFPDGSPGQKKLKRSELLSLIEADDDCPKFGGFTNLPPELRNRIYECHFAAFSQPIYAPSQPPVTRTCQLIRSDSLRMFYASCTFEFRRDGDLPLSVGEKRSNRYIPAVSLGQIMFLHRTPAELLALITRFDIGCALPKSNSLHHRFSIAIADGEIECGVAAGSVHTQGKARDIESAMRAWNEGGRKVVSEDMILTLIKRL